MKHILYIILLCPLFIYAKINLRFETEQTPNGLYLNVEGVYNNHSFKGSELVIHKHISDKDLNVSGGESWFPSKYKGQHKGLNPRERKRGDLAIIALRKIHTFVGQLCGRDLIGDGLWFWMSYQEFIRDKFDYNRFGFRFNTEIILSLDYSLRKTKTADGEYKYDSAVVYDAQIKNYFLHLTCPKNDRPKVWRNCIHDSIAETFWFMKKTNGRYLNLYLEPMASHFSWSDWTKKNNNIPKPLRDYLNNKKVYITERYLDDAVNQLASQINAEVIWSKEGLNRSAVLKLRDFQYNEHTFSGKILTR